MSYTCYESKDGTDNDSPWGPAEVVIQCQPDANGRDHFQADLSDFDVEAIFLRVQGAFRHRLSTSLSSTWSCGVILSAGNRKSTVRRSG